MKDRGVLRTVSLLAASLVAAASLMTAPVTAAGSEAEEVLGRLSGTASVSQIPASTNVAQQDEVNAIWIAFLDLCRGRARVLSVPRFSRCIRTVSMPG